ncbi:MAG: hypothetical protein LWX83_16545 [Anaerolineae bacterium]|nr:hypothetical protein [Anaerolineae bacterium]
MSSIRYQLKKSREKKLLQQFSPRPVGLRFLINHLHLDTRSIYWSDLCDP